MRTRHLYEAFSFAKEKHRDQRYGEEPYIVHPMRVCATLIKHNIVDEATLISGLLHDTIEDTGTTREEIEARFGKEVADIVWAVTNEPGKNRRERHEKTYPKIAADRRAVAVKISDRNVNLRKSLDTNEKIGMYLKEHEAFQATFYREGEYDSLWKEYNDMIAEAYLRKLEG